MKRPVEMIQMFRKLRNKRGVSRERMAYELGVSVNSIRLWELGGVIPNKENRAKVDEYFGTTVLYRHEVPVED